MTVEPLPAPLLATIPRVELGEVGTWNISNIAGWHPTADDFASAVSALDCPAVRRPVLKFGHTGEQGEGDPALGYIDNMAVTDDGQVLVGDYAGVPGWMADVDSDGQFVLKSAYASRSGEWEHNYVCQLGHTHPFVLHAMALLGVVRPGIGTLQDLHDMYTTPPEPLMPASSTTTPQSAATPDDVRYAYYSGPGSSWDLWVREMYIDPPELIVENDADRTLLRVPYTCLSDGTITFGESQTVTIQYVAARAATPDARQMAFSSKAEARHGIPHTPAAAPAPGPAAAGGTSTTKEEVGMPDTLIEGLRKLVGTADDADEATVLSAVTEALSEQVTETPAESAEFQVPEGMVLMPAAAVADLQEAAKTTKVLAEAAAKQERDSFLDANRTKYLPASRAAWETQYKVDPEGTKAYFSSAPEIVPVSAVGHSADPAAVEDDGWFDGYSTPKAG